MFNYAQINELGHCIGISTVSNEVISNNMILIPEYDDAYIFRIYNIQKKEWTNEYLPPKEVQPQLTLEDIKNDTAPIKETITLTADDALTIMEYQTVLDEKLSKIITHLGL